MKVGRNDSCPCGSNKKFKNCCGASSNSFKVTPQNKPEVINHHLVSNNGGRTWEKRPGNLSAIICGVKPEDFDQEIDALLSSYLNTLRKPNDNTLENKLLYCRHKLHAVRYHLLTIKKDIKENVKEFESNYSAGSGVALEIENPRLVYETEAFLFQVKSCLDVLTRVLGEVIPPLNSMRSFKKGKVDGVEKAGGKVINSLKRNGFEELGNLFERHTNEWIQKLVEMRDQITHYGNLRGFSCFIEEPYKGGEKVTIHYPTMPSGIKVDDYCQDTYDRLLDLYESALKFITNKK
jgi:hypothetical protein